MENDPDVPNSNLTYPDVILGRKETPWDLRPLLFMGGAAAPRREVARRIDAGDLEGPLLERLNLVQKVHEVISAALTGGGSKFTALNQIENFRRFFRWAEALQHPLNDAVIERTFLCWSDHMFHRSRVVKNISETSAYNQVRVVGHLLDRALERSSPILLNTRLLISPKRKRVLGVEAEKQSLTDVFLFGQALLDITDGLPLDVVWGPLPVRITYRGGQELEEWSGLPHAKLRGTDLKTPKQRFAAKFSQRIRDEYEKDRTLRTRYRIVNLRIEAELLVFIAQTGMNLSQAHKLKMRHYRFKSTIDGYEVRDYKQRAKGEVVFEIFSEYKEMFERYLKWREAIFRRDKEERLFPLVRLGGRAEDTPPNFWRLRKTCNRLGLNFVSPRKLRNTRVNWVLRRTNDPDLTSEQAQHRKEILFRVYEEPSLQRAMVEITRFWQGADPGLPSPAPGVCDGVPVPTVDIPLGATQPDCVRPTGCLWCEHHRDIDSQDYVWAMASMRYLKILALGGICPSADGKTNETARYIEMAIDRLTTKMCWFRQSNEVRRRWVVEALERIDEGSYHPHWQYLIAAVEEV
jgi:hypothetical protein